MQQHQHQHQHQHQAWLGPLGSDVLLASWARTGALAPADMGALLLVDRAWAAEVGRHSEALLQGHLEGPGCPMSPVSWARVLRPAELSTMVAARDVMLAHGVRLGALEAAVAALQAASAREWGAQHRRALGTRLHPRALWRQAPTTTSATAATAAVATLRVLSQALDPLHTLHHARTREAGKAKTDLRLWAWYVRLQWLSRMFAACAVAPTHAQLGGTELQLLRAQLQEMRRVRWDDANVNMHVKVGQLASLVLARVQRVTPAHQREGEW